jgi:WD40 repeat protein
MEKIRKHAKIVMRRHILLFTFFKAALLPSVLLISSTSVGSTLPDKLRQKVQSVAIIREEEGITPAALVFSPNEKFLAVRSIHQKINIWDWKNKERLLSLEIPKGANDSLTVTPILFSPDGTKLVACYGAADNKQVVTVWNTSSWKVEQEIVDREYGSGSTVCRFTPDGKYLIRALTRLQRVPGPTLIIYDTKSWLPKIARRTNPFFISDIDVSTDGKTLALIGFVAPTTEKEKPFNDKTFSDIGPLGTAHVLTLDLESISIKNDFKLQESIDNRARLAWVPGKPALAYAIGKELRELDLNRGSEACISCGGDHALGVFSSLTYSAESQRLAFAHDLTNSNVQIFGEGLASLLLTIEVNNNCIATLSKSGQYIAVSSGDGVKVYQINH